ncbi:hypothetical protein DO021_21540 [Desulfobacter hydrogenophilus]|uniref:Uncharacterized protein n=1 Tax=Desulfobacter hydrogenophilus TaxID=2291 RepID=A0A328F638_9BACT|nr:hypothetical protein DO021_21540 [Desulfobacter hydrogenophilus]
MGSEILKSIKSNRSSFNKRNHRPEALASSDIILISECGNTVVALLVKIFLIYLVLVPLISLIEYAPPAPGDEKISVPVNDLNQVPDGIGVGDTHRALPAADRQNLNMQKPDEVSSDVQSQPEFVAQDVGKETCDKTDNAEAGADEDFIFWHEASIYFLIFGVSFLFGHSRWQSRNDAD